MKEILKDLQDLQIEALERGVSAFHLDIVRGDDGDYIISASVRLRDDDTEGDYISEYFYSSAFRPEFKINRIKAFIEQL